MRTRIWGIWFVIIVGVLIAFSPPVRAQNPVPLISQPLVPTIAAPGGPSFTLVVNGTGFVSGSVVNWNGSARLTTFVSGSTLKAAITAADVALAGTGLGYRDQSHSGRRRFRRSVLPDHELGVHCHTKQIGFLSCQSSHLYGRGRL